MNLDNMHELDTEEQYALDQIDELDQEIEAYELDQIYQMGEE